MATKAELLAKIEKAKANKMMPDALKKQYIDKIQKEIDALPADKAPKAKQEPAKKEHQRYKIQWFNSKAKPQRVEDKIFTGENAYEDAVAWGKKTLDNFNSDQIQTTTDYPSVAQATEKKDKNEGKGHAAKWTSSYTEYYGNVIAAMEDSGEMTTSDAQGIADPHEDWLRKKHNDGVLPGAAAVLLLRKTESKPEPKKAEPKKAAPKKAEPAKPAGKKGVDYDCDELIEKEKARKASAKKSAKKSPAKKSGDTIEKTGDAIEKKAEEGELTKEQILALIQKFKKEIRRLEKLLKTAK